MKTTAPIVSVIMTSFNAEGFIVEAIESILNQTYKHLELIIVDDASTDDTWEIIQRFAHRDERIRAFRMKHHSGPSACSNLALPKARGEYIARADSDDVSYLTRLEKQVAFMESHPHIMLSSGQMDVINEEGDTIGKKSFPTSHAAIVNELCVINPVAHPGWIFRKSLVSKYGISYNKKYFVSHDLKILFQVLEYGSVANISDTIVKYRYRPNSITHRNPKQVFMETREIRNWAIMKNGYKPPLKNLLLHLAQMVTVPFVPNKLIVTAFILWRVKPAKELSRGIRRTTLQGYRFAIKAVVVLTGLLLLDKKL